MHDYIISCFVEKERGRRQKEEEEREKEEEGKSKNELKWIRSGQHFNIFK